jgi:tRNA-splicing ligase RtcB
MGTGSYVLAESNTSEVMAFSSASHGAGRAMSRRQALKQWCGKDLVAELANRGILIRSHSIGGVAGEAPGAYKDVELVTEATERTGLANRVAFLRPKVCIKG